MKICLTGNERDTRWPKTATNLDCFCSGLTLVSKNVNTQSKMFTPTVVSFRPCYKTQLQSWCLCVGREQMSWAAFSKVGPAVISEHLTFLTLDVFHKDTVWRYLLEQMFIVYLTLDTVWRFLSEQNFLAFLTFDKATVPRWTRPHVVPFWQSWGTT